MLFGFGKNAPEAATADTTITTPVTLPYDYEKGPRLADSDNSNIVYVDWNAAVGNLWIRPTNNWGSSDATTFDEVINFVKEYTERHPDNASLSIVSLLTRRNSMNPPSIILKATGRELKIESSSFCNPLDVSGNPIAHTQIPAIIAALGFTDTDYRTAAKHFINDRIPNINITIRKS